MPDGPNLPAKTPPLDRAAIERVLARASELQATSANTDQSGLLTEAELLEIGKEAGISPNTLTQALAEEVRQHGIRVSLICPGSTDTSFFGGTSKASKSRERMLTPADIAHAVAMIVTQEANSFISEVIMRPTMKP